MSRSEVFLIVWTCLHLGAPGLPAQQPAAAESRPAFQVIPDPNLSNLEEAVQEQLKAARQILNEQLADPDTPSSDLAESFFSLGQLYHAYDLRSSARACYQNALILEATDYRPTYLLGNLAQTEGEFGEAIFFYQRARQLRPEEVPPAVHLAEVLAQQGQTEEAARLYREALELDSSCAAAHFGLGQLALSERRFEEAVEQFQKALQLVPAATQIHYPLALAYRGLGRVEEAQRHLQLRGEAGVRVADPLIEGLAGMKTGEVVHLLMGRRAYQAGDYQSAAQFFERAVQAAPQSFRALTNLGTTLAALGDREGAIENFRAAVAAGSESPSVHYNLAVLLNQRGDHREAVEHLEFLLERYPDDQPAHVELALASKALGQPEKALEEIQKAIQLRPGDPNVRLEEAVVLVDLERFEEAIEKLTEANRLFPEDGPIAHGLARLLAAAPDPSLRNGEKALRLALSVFQARQLPLFGETVALAYAEAGYCDQAAEFLRQLVEQAQEANSEQWTQRFQQRLQKVESGEGCRP